MTVSARLQQLQERIDELARHLLPKPRPTGLYTERQYDLIRSFVLLAHAEIESCIEDLSEATAVDAYAAWFIDSRPRTCLLALTAFHEGKWPALPQEVAELKAGKDADSLRNRLKTSRDQFCSRIAANNGIKERDLLSMLLPLGFSLADLDNAWISTTSSFGGYRGDIAHRAKTAQSLPDPVDELAKIKQILDGLSPIDEKMAALRQPGT